MGGAVAPPPVSSSSSSLGSVGAVRSCPLGGKAEVLKVSTSDTGLSEVRIVVTPAVWTPGYVVTLGILGDGLQPGKAINAQFTTDGPVTLADYSFSYILGTKPAEYLGFAAVLTGMKFD